jgi:hypothetical protein
MVIFKTITFICSLVLFMNMDAKITWKKNLNNFNVTEIDTFFNRLSSP